MSVTLIVGCDDSNHAGTTKGEIVVATFSRELKHLDIVEYEREREAEVVNQLTREEMDYCFTIITDDQIRRQRTVLPTVVPFLFSHYATINCPNIRRAHFQLDGEIREEDERIFRNEFPDLKLTVKGFPKSKGRPISYPPLVYAADTIANRLFRTPFEELVQHPKLVSLSTQQQEYIRKLKQRR